MSDEIPPTDSSAPAVKDQPAQTPPERTAPELVDESTAAEEPHVPHAPQVIDESAAAEEPHVPHPGSIASSDPDEPAPIDEAAAAELHSVATSEVAATAVDSPVEATDEEDQEQPEEEESLEEEQSEGESLEEEPVEEAAAAEPVPAPPPQPTKRWYVVKVQSNREDTIKAAIERKVKIEGLEELYGQIAIPVEEYMEKKKVKTTDKKTGEKVTQEKTVAKHRKKFPGYIFAEVEYDDRILYLFRETSGVGDFVGATKDRAPNPMTDREVEAMLTGVPQPGDPRKPKKILKIDIEKGDKVRVREGAFSGMEGEVKMLSEPKDADETPKVTVVVTVFGRPVDVTLDYWQVDKA